MAISARFSATGSPRMSLSRKKNKLPCTLAIAAFSAAMLAAGAAAPTRAATVDVNGTINWSDGQGLLHAARLDNVYLLNASSHAVVASGSTNLQGQYDLSFNYTLPGLRRLSLIEQIAPDNPAAYVSSAGTMATMYNVYTSSFRVGSGNNYVGVNMQNSIAATQAFSIADAALTTSQFATVARGAAPAQVAIAYPTTPPSNVSFYNGAAGRITIARGDRYDWDVIGHEYGHYLEHVDHLATAVGGRHSFGVTNIPNDATNAQKIRGAELAWSEGLATYIGVAAQQVNPVGFNRPNLQNVGDTYYQDYGRVDLANKRADFEIDLASYKVVGYSGATATTFNSVGQGEGDELPVARVLWDIADPVNNTWDRVSRGYAQVYKDLVAAAAANGGQLSTLSQVDNYYLFTVAKNDRQRTDYGAIFMHNGISPQPTGAMAGKPTLSAVSPPPTFNWIRNNFGRNDTFDLIIWSDPTLNHRLLDYIVPGDVNTYTLTAAQWALVDAVPGTREFVITGSETRRPDGTPYTGLAYTGPYWSDAYSFTVSAPAPAPEPASIAVTCVGLSALALKRRATGVARACRFV